MFEAFVFVCMLNNPTKCHTLQDTQGPYQTERQCEVRAYEIAMELPQYMPDYVAVKYKCTDNEEKVDI